MTAEFHKGVGATPRGRPSIVRRHEGDHMGSPLHGNMREDQPQR